MHELSICESIVRAATAYLAEHPTCRIDAVNIEIGRLSGVDPDALEFAFPAALEAAKLDGIRLRIERKPVTLRCAACRAESEVVRFEMKCGACGSPEVTIAGGRELKVKSFEITEN